MACSLHNVDISVQAKREIGKLWEDITKKPYIDIINPTVTAIKVMRCVQIYRVTTKILKEKEISSSGKDKSHYIHSNRFVLHVVFQKVGSQILMDPAFDFNNYKNTVLNDLITNTVEDTKKAANRLYKNSLVHQIYRNFTKCRDIKNAIIV